MRLFQVCCRLFNIIVTRISTSSTRIRARSHRFWASESTTTTYLSFDVTMMKESDFLLNSPSTHASIKKSIKFRTYGSRVWIISMTIMTMIERNEWSWVRKTVKYWTDHSIFISVTDCLRGFHRQFVYTMHTRRGMQWINCNSSAHQLPHMLGILTQWTQQSMARDENKWSENKTIHLSLASSAGTNSIFVLFWFFLFSPLVHLSAFHFLSISFVVASTHCYRSDQFSITCNRRLVAFISRYDFIFAITHSRETASFAALTSARTHTSSHLFALRFSRSLSPFIARFLLLFDSSFAPLDSCCRRLRLVANYFSP